MSTEPDLKLKIGQVAQRVGINAKTIRYYEDIGLLPEPARLPSGYRAYGDEDVDRLAFIRRSQHFGLSLDEIGEVLAFRQNGERPCGFVLDAVRRRAAEVDERIAELIQLRAELGDLIDRADAEAATPARYCHLLEPNGG